MGVETMGRVIVKVRIQNLQDLWNVKAAQLSPDKVRTLEADNAVVDTGAKLLCLPKHLIEQLGLNFFQSQKATTATGIVPCNLYQAVRLTIQDRECNVDVAEVADDCPILVGYVPLELLDFVVDPVGQRLIGNPAHGGENIVDLL